VIDIDRLRIHEPFVRHDLPNGESRILQPSSGYVATLVNGEITRRHDEDTGRRPGQLVRGH
jgi:N-acyl-D-aspartate/D-glutamate deacylase